MKQPNQKQYWIFAPLCSPSSCRVRTFSQPHQLCCPHRGPWQEYADGDAGLTSLPPWLLSPEGLLQPACSPGPSCHLLLLDVCIAKGLHSRLVAPEGPVEEPDTASFVLSLWSEHSLWFQCVLRSRSHVQPGGFFVGHLTFMYTFGEWLSSAHLLVILTMVETLLKYIPLHVISEVLSSLGWGELSLASTGARWLALAVKGSS